MTTPFEPSETFEFDEFDPYDEMESEMQSEMESELTRRPSRGRLTAARPKPARPKPARPKPARPKPARQRRQKLVRPRALGATFARDHARGLHRRYRTPTFDGYVAWVNGRPVLYRLGVGGLLAVTPAAEPIAIDDTATDAAPDATLDAPPDVAPDAAPDVAPDTADDADTAEPAQNELPRRGCGCRHRDAGGVEREIGARATDRDYIRWIQQSLNRLTGAALAVDGIAGAQTRAAVRTFQQRAALTVDGVVGPNTERALIAAGAGRPPSGGAPVYSPPVYGPPSPAPAPAPNGSAAACAQPARPALRVGVGDGRCTGAPPTCPEVRDMLCVKDVAGLPLLYLQAVPERDPTTGLLVPTRLTSSTHQFNRATLSALGAFVANMRALGMPVQAVLSLGSYNCRCMSNTNTLSNHAYGDAIDVAGVRWASPSQVGSRLHDTIVHNYCDPEQRALLARVNACLRLSFATVIDYHRSDHRNHFHCDMNRGGGRSPRGSTTVVFVQEALSNLLGRPLARDGGFGPLTQDALRTYARAGNEVLESTALLNETLDRLFRDVASRTRRWTVGTNDACPVRP